MTIGEHLSLEQVRAYVRGALHPSTLVATDDHLEACASCRAALARESDASFGAEAFGRALAAPEPRAESPHLAFEHLRGAVEGALGPIDREWVDQHIAQCPMCAEELRDLERYATTLPGRPVAPVAEAAPMAPAVPAPSSHGSLASPYQTSPAPPRLRTTEAAPDDPPARYGETPKAALPLWIKLAAGASLLAIVQLWAC